MILEDAILLLKYPPWNEMIFLWMFYLYHAPAIMLNIRFSTGDKIKIGTIWRPSICKEFRLKRKRNVMYMYYPKEGAWFSLKWSLTQIVLTIWILIMIIGMKFQIISRN